MTPWLAIVGMGDDGFDGIAARGRRLLEEAEVIIGATRLLRYLPALKAEQVAWPQPFKVVADRILGFRGRPTAVLATGDPMNHGVAVKLLDFVSIAETIIVPHISAFSLAAARMGWSLPDCDTLTLHGRPVACLEPFIQPGARLIALTADGTTPAEAARRLCARGFGASTITVLENLDGDSERRIAFQATAVPDQRFSDLNTIAIECVAAPDATIRSRVPGLPDDAFLHDGQLTKREVRAATLAALGPRPDALLWDVGAGCGSIGIEWMRASRGARAIAIERDPRRLSLIAGNSDHLGTPRLAVVAGEAPGALHDLARPDAVFIGGGLTEPGVFESCWAALKPAGTLVANTVTLEGEARAIALHETHGGELVRIEISILKQVGRLRALEPRMPVLQWRAAKPW